MFSAHDSNLIPFMLAYNLTSRDCLWNIYKSKYANNTDLANLENEKLDDVRCESAPQFASSLLWELTKHATSGEYFMRSKFDGEFISFCEQGKEVEDMYCPLDSFILHANHHLVLDQ